MTYGAKPTKKQGLHGEITECKKQLLVMSLPRHLNFPSLKYSRLGSNWQAKQILLLNRPEQTNRWKDIDYLATGSIEGDYLSTSGMRLESFFPASNKSGYLGVFTLGNGLHNIAKFDRAYAKHLPIVFCEDGFLSCIATHNNCSVDLKFRTSCSLTCDTRGFYFDASTNTDLESLLNSREVSESELLSAKALREMIVANRLSKYNCQPTKIPSTLTKSSRSKVLVIDQDFGDYSTLLGDATAGDFEIMLHTAVLENPDSDIIVKTHPDAAAVGPGARKGYYSEISDHAEASGKIIKISDPVNPYSLIDIVDKVYVATSTFGFEALLAGKEVHCFGIPWYSGWGATIDNKPTPRRTAKRNVDELLYIFYCIYTRWCDIATRTPCSIYHAIDQLLHLRKEYTELGSYR